MKNARNERPDGVLPVEPLSDISWQRVERNVFAELDAAPAAAPAPRQVARPAWSMPSWRWMIPATALAAAAVILIVFLRRPGEPQTVALADRDGGALGAGPSRIATGESATEVVFGDATITVAPHSAVHFGGDAATGAQVLLERGAVACAVAPRRGRPPFAVVAGTVRVEVVGTRFSVERHDDLALVEVSEGTVQVVADGRRIPVTAGERWPAEETASADPDSEREGPDTDSRERASGHRDRDRKSSSRRTERSDDQERDREATPEPDDRARYEQAAELEASSPAAALDIYRDLAAGSGAWAANALFAAGRLEAEHHHTDGARRLLMSYLRRFPRGLNADDAHALLERLQAESQPQPKDPR
jgi:ferric-dicitrate binding protein FerR (iron transport regulator)